LIAYLDTSSLVKIYVAEPGSVAVRRLVDRADVVSTSMVAYAEARAALARQRREGGLTAGEQRRARDDLDADWPRLLALDVDQPVAQRAGDLAERHGLRGFDSLHLASFLSLVAEFPGEDVQFSSFDGRLNRAAKRERRARRARRRPS
jgi:predicted nucleic acid-binding protein